MRLVTHSTFNIQNSLTFLNCISILVLLFRILKHAVNIMTYNLKVHNFVNCYRFLHFMHNFYSMTSQMVATDQVITSFPSKEIFSFRSKVKLKGNIF